MAGEIQVAFRCTPHRVTNPNVVYDHLTLTNGLYLPSGWRFRDTEVGNLLIHLPAIPAEIHATTPNGKLRVRWVTASASANAWKLFAQLSDVNPDTDSYDPATFDLDTNATDTSPAAGRCNTLDVTITGASLTAGRELIGVLKRDSGDAGDTLAADVLITEVLLIADKA